MTELEAIAEIQQLRIDLNIALRAVNALQRENDVLKERNKILEHLLDEIEESLKKLNQYLEK